MLTECHLALGHSESAQGIMFEERLRFGSFEAQGCAVFVWSSNQKQTMVGYAGVARDDE